MPKVSYLWVAEPKFAHSLNLSSFKAHSESNLSHWVMLTYRFPKFIVGEITSDIPGTMESAPPLLFRNFIKALYSCNKSVDSIWPREQSPWRPTCYTLRLNGNPPKCLAACLPCILYRILVKTGSQWSYYQWFDKRERPLN